MSASQAEHTPAVPQRPPIRIGALAPLSPPGWVEAGTHLLAGLRLAIDEVNGTDGGILGRPLELVVRDTAADPGRADVAVQELARSGVAAVVGEYHSVAARAAALRADAIGLPFLCSSAVLDQLTDSPSMSVARLAPRQSRGWQIYADFLRDSGHRRIAIASQSSLYWRSGIHILRSRLGPTSTILELDVGHLSPSAVCAMLVESDATALLLLVGHPEPGVSIVRAVRRDKRLAKLDIGAPAGQPEFRDWLRRLGGEGSGISFLRYRRAELEPLGARVDHALRERLHQTPSFVALEGYDTGIALASALRAAAVNGTRQVVDWGAVTVQGSRGRIRFSRPRDALAWQWEGAPIEVVARDPHRADRCRVLREA